jgi:uracil-DNA glycosylase
VTWQQLPFFASHEWSVLQKRVARRRRETDVYPTAPHVLRALDAVPPDDVRVVILGQDPYHGEGQAHGLAFSVPQGMKPPPSLRNILKEVASDLGDSPADFTDLSPWARQGVLLLNTVLTVEAGRPGAHAGWGWERLTDEIIAHLGRSSEPRVFMLWGAPARRKAGLIDRASHCVLEAPHPSPLSAYRGFFGCRHFSQANAFLQAHDRGAIDWLGAGEQLNCSL